MARHYLDHASTSPARPQVVEAMLPWLVGAADPARVHTEGRLARAAMEEARQQVAALFGARPREVVFTSGATEAINTAVWGAVERGSHIVCSAVEHAAVREASARLAQVSWIGTDRFGRVDPDEVMAAVKPGETSLVHVQWGNHEVGTLQPATEVVNRCRQAGVLVHVDAAAACGHVPVDFGVLGADLCSVSAHKLGGPQGMGALLVRRGLRLRPFLIGGDQERARRAGLENLPAAVGFGAAAALLNEHDRLAGEAATNRQQSERLRAFLSGQEGVSLYGHPTHRLPHIVCFGLDGVEAEAVVVGLDRAGVAVHSGSGCSSESLEPSPVLTAMDIVPERSLRVSMGWSTSEANLKALEETLPEVVNRLRDLGR